MPGDTFSFLQSSMTSLSRLPRIFIKSTVFASLNSFLSCNDIESRRYYAINFQMLVQGYILNEDDFEITPLKDRSMVFVEGNSKGVLKPKIRTIYNRDNQKSIQSVDYEVLFKYKSIDEVTINAFDSLTINEILLEDTFNVNTIKYFKNGVIQEVIPFTVERGDDIKIAVERVENSVSRIILKAQKL